jgi:serine/threonine protein kinase
LFLIFVLYAYSQFAAKEFLQALMQHDPAVRPTACEALKLPWLKEAHSEGCAKKKALSWKVKAAGASSSKIQKASNAKKNSMATMRKGSKHTRVAKKDHVCTTSTVSNHKAASQKK